MYSMLLNNQEKGSELGLYSGLRPDAGIYFQLQFGISVPGPVRGRGGCEWSASTVQIRVC